MADVIINVDLERPDDESRLFSAIETFAKWQDPAHQGPSDAPDIMVKTEHRPDVIRKKLIFQDRDWAAAFLRYWRHENRQNA